VKYGKGRVAVWRVAVVRAYGVIWLGFPLPSLGRSRRVDDTIQGEHVAERCWPFDILALGESVLVTGASFGRLPG
jgi:low temperature requirement protein LtrA